MAFDKLRTNGLAAQSIRGERENKMAFDRLRPYGLVAQSIRGEREN